MRLLYDVTLSGNVYSNPKVYCIILGGIGTQLVLCIVNNVVTHRRKIKLNEISMPSSVR